MNHPSFSRRLTLSRYRHPERWAVARRGAMVLGTIGGLAIARGRTIKGLRRVFTATNKVNAKREAAKTTILLSGLSGSRLPGYRAARTLRASVRAQRTLKAKQRKLRTRAIRFSTAMKRTAAVGVGYTLMPLAHKRGEYNYKKRVLKEYIR